MNAASANFTELAVKNWSIEGANVLIAELAPLDGSDLPSWEAGAHIDIKARDRVCAVAMAKRTGVLRFWAMSTELEPRCIFTKR